MSDQSGQDQKAARAKPILCLDFDGVIHSYASGWQGANVISDPPVDGAIEFIIAASGHFTIAIHSSRSAQPGGIIAMYEWLKDYWIDYDHNHFEIFNAIQWPKEKPPAFLTLDDRAITFTGTWPDPQELTKFKPWNKK